MDKVSKALVILLTSLGILAVTLLAFGVYADRDTRVEVKLLRLQEDSRGFEDIHSTTKKGAAAVTENDLRDDQDRQKKGKNLSKEETVMSGPDIEELDHCGRNPWYEATNGAMNPAPWIVCLIGSGGICQGVFISRRHVLLDAFCAAIMNITSAVVPNPSGDNPEIVQVAEKFFHPDLHDLEDFKKGKNLCVVTLEKPSTLSMKMQPACLPPDTATKINGYFPNMTAYGFAMIDGPWDRFSTKVEAYGPGAFFNALKKFNANAPGAEHIKGIEMITLNHLGVLGDSKMLQYTALFYEDGFGLTYVVGVGPVFVTPEDLAILYTNVVPHLKWLQAILTKGKSSRS